MVTSIDHFILYMAPGGHRQWPFSIEPLLDRLSWIVLQTRPLALKHLREALQDNPDWQPKYRHGPRIDLVPAVPYKFLDIGTKMGYYHLEELIPKKEDKNNILHPRHTRSGIPPVNIFHSALQDRVGSQYCNVEQWCVENVWFESSALSLFHSDNRRGYARVTPVALSSVGMPGSSQRSLDKYPTHGLGIYDDYETSENFNGYLWATMEAQPMQIDPALQAMIDQSAQVTSGQTGPSYDLGTSVDVDLPSQPMGCNEQFLE